MSPDVDEVEVELRRRFDTGDLDGTLALAIETYGSALFGFLVGLARDRTRADDAFAATCERMWKGLPKFRWTSSLRVWTFTIARNEFLRTTRETTRARRQVPISQVASVQQAIDRARSLTPVHEQTAVKDKFAALREQLEPEDHMLLGLRLEQKLSWNEIATVLADESGTTHTAAALRKRFERLKTKLRELANDAS